MRRLWILAAVGFLVAVLLPAPGAACTIDLSPDSVVVDSSSDLWPGLALPLFERLDVFSESEEEPDGERPLARRSTHPSTGPPDGRPLHLRSALTRKRVADLLVLLKRRNE